MPSFLSKVFGRKKEDAADSPTPTKGHKHYPSLLEGKFEAVVTPASPIAPNFAVAQQQPKDKDGGFALFRIRSRQSNSPISKPTEEFPTLSLNLPGQKEENGTRVLGVVFEGDRLPILDDSVIASKRLNPIETLTLVRACSQVIIERGLETLGIMHPHWHSASPDIQRRLISLFIQSLSTKETPPSPTPFEYELKFTRSPHDVAAVLRWGLRHLKLDGNSFGKDSSEWQWYQTFFTSEHSAGYPRQAFSEQLMPLLPKPHLDLLLATLEIESSLASHAEHNSISGSKLSKFLGLWLLTASRSEVNDDWDTFYARWERAGRILEHLFLCRIRDESVNHRIPTRLIELVNQYPYNKGSSTTDEEVLPRPRFSTRPYDALFVRIDTELPASTTEKPRRDRLRLLAEAFKLDLPSESGEYAAVWDKVKQAAMEASDAEDNSASKASPVLNRVFADETIRLLSLIPADGIDSPIHLISPSMARPAASLRRSTSLSHIPDKGTKDISHPNGNGTTVHAKASATPLPPPPAIDWASFSAAGFGEPSPVSQHLSATLLDQDIEMTDPSVARKLSRPKRNRDSSRRSSADSPNLIKPNGTSSQQKTISSKATVISVIQLDEAFIDFWSDAAIDPISSPWPAFVICKLNPIPGVQSKEGKPINWLVIEQTYSSPPVPRSTPQTTPGKRTSSPKPSVRSDLSLSLSATRKRFSFFGGGNTVSSGKVDKTSRTKTSPKMIKTGELGEILPEMDEKPESKIDTPAAKAVDVKESPVASGPGAAETTESVKPEDKADTAAIEGIDANVIAAITGAAAVVGGVAAEKAASERSQHTVVPTNTLPPAPESVVLSGDTPGPQIALDTSEPAAVAQAEPPVTVEQTPALAEDAPGPQLVSDKKAATIEPLKEQEDDSPAFAAIKEVPVVPVPALSEEVHAPEPIAEVEPVYAAPPSPVPVAHAPIEPVNEPEEAAPELTKEVTPEPILESDPEPTVEPETIAMEVPPEPAKEVDPEPVVEPEPEQPVEVPAEPETVPIEAPPEPTNEVVPEPTVESEPEPSAEEVAPETIVESPEPPVEVSAEPETVPAELPAKEVAPEPIVEPEHEAPAPPETSQEAVHEAPAEVPEPSVEAPAEPEPKSEEPELATEQAAPLVEQKSAEILNGAAHESHIPEASS